MASRADLDIVVQFLTNLAHLAPMLIVYLIGGLTALHFWRRAPKPALVTLLAMLLLAANLAVSAIGHVLLPRLLMHNGVEGISTAFFALSAFNSVASAVGLGMLLYAVFCDRRGNG